MVYSRIYGVLTVSLRYSTSSVFGKTRTSLCGGDSELRTRVVLQGRRPKIGDGLQSRVCVTSTTWCRPTCWPSAVPKQSRWPDQSNIGYRNLGDAA